MRPRKKDRHLPAKVYFRHGAYYYVHKGVWRQIGKDLPAALAEYARITQTPTGGMAQLIQRTLDEARERGVAKNTIEQYELAAKKIIPAFIEFAPNEVKPQHIASFMDAYRKTPNMANRYRTVLRLAFSIAVRAGQCESNPVTEIAPFKEKKRDRYLTDAEYDRIIAKSSPLLRCIIEIAYLTGQRISDVIAIKRDDLTAEGISFQQQKTGARLCVAWTPELKAAVDRAKALHGKTPRLYLLGLPNGKKRSYRGVRDLYERAARKAKVPDTTLHDLRAKALTDAKKQGLNPTALAGHTTEAQTVRYIRNRETALVQGPSIGQKGN